MVNFAIIPERTALINVDLQNCFADGYAFSAPTGWRSWIGSTAWPRYAARPAFWLSIPAMCSGQTSRIWESSARWPHLYGQASSTKAPDQRPSMSDLSLTRATYFSTSLDLARSTALISN